MWRISQPTDKLFFIVVGYVIFSESADKLLVSQEGLCSIGLVNLCV